MTPSQKTILIADDSLTERQAMCAALGPGGYRILEVADGVAAIAVAHAERPALVILDVYLPRMNGVAVCRALKALCTEANYLPVLMVSSRASVNARLEGLRSGADDFMAKPIEPKELRTRVDALLRLLEMPATPVQRDDWRGQARDDSRAVVREEWRSGSADERGEVGWTRRADAGGLSPVVVPQAPNTAFSALPPSTSLTPANEGRGEAASRGHRSAVGAREDTHSEGSAAVRFSTPPVSTGSEDPSDEPAVGGQLFSQLSERVEKRLTQEFARARRFSEPLACLVVGVDGYFSLVRRFGEACALELHVINDAAARAVRQIDLVFELDDGRLLVLLPNTHFIGAVAAAERMWREMRGVRLRSAGQQELSASVGVSFFPNRDTQSVRDLVRLAGIALQVAQAEGNGRICLYQHQRYIYTPDAA